MKISEMVKIRSGVLVSLKESENVHTAVKKMLSTKESGVLVVSSHNKPVGIFTEKDVMRLLGDKYTQLEKIELGEVMSRNLTTITSDMTIETAMAIMTKKNFHHLLVSDQELVRSLISMDDLIAAKMVKTETEAKILKDYISQS